MMYHIILFVSFTASILMMPTIKSMTSQYIQNEILLWIVPFIIAYLGAIYLFPELGFMLYKSMTRD